MGHDLSSGYIIYECKCFALGFVHRASIGLRYFVRRGLVISFSGVNEASASKDGNGYMLMPPNDRDNARIAHRHAFLSFCESGP